MASFRPSYPYLAVCLIVVSAVRVGLSTVGYARTGRILGAYSPVRTNAGGDIRKVAWGVRSAARFVPGASCLTQALAGRVLLAAMGKASTIRLGIDKASPSELKAHAWLLADGRIVLGGHSSSMQNFAHIADLEPGQ